MILSAVYSLEYIVVLNKSILLILRIFILFQRFSGSQTLLSNAERYALYLARAARSVNETEPAVVVSRDNIGINDNTIIISVSDAYCY